MPATSSIYLDTNAIIALVEGPATTGAGLKDFLAICAGKAIFNISALCFAELLVVPYRNKHLALAQEYLGLAENIPGLTIHPVDLLILDTTAMLRANRARLKLPDAIHLATASRSRCQYFFSFDKDFVDLPQISHPFFDEAALMPVKIIRPDPASLSELSKVLAP